MSTDRSEKCANSADPEIAHPLSGRHAINAMQSELKDFTEQTMRRLQTLSLSFRKCQHVPQTLASEHGQGVEQEKQPLLLPLNSDPASAFDRDCEPHVEMPMDTAHEQLAGTDDADPMERLNAIKQRLAQQMQNTL